MKKLFKNIDFTIPLIVLILIMIGLIMIESATYTSINGFFKNIFIKKQILAAVIGCIAAMITLFFDYRILQDYVNIIYVSNILLLIIVLFLGRTVNGGQGWLELGPVNFQPAELAKIATIIVLADLLAQRKYDMEHIIGWIIPALYLAVPFGLIILQNDLF